MTEKTRRATAVYIKGLEEQSRKAQAIMDAAPEMLTAIKDALAYLDRSSGIATHEWYKVAPEHVKEFRRVIAKAEGGGR